MYAEDPKQNRAQEEKKAKERPIHEIYPVVDTDLGRDNLENDIPAADREDL